MNILERPEVQRFGEMSYDLVLGGAGVAGGMVGAKFIGDAVEGMITTAPITPASTLGSKMTAWFGSNVPKLAMAYVVSTFETESEPVNKILSGVTYGVAGSIVTDTYARLMNDGVPTLILDPSANSKVKSLMSENTSLKTALTRLSKQKSITPSPATMKKVPLDGNVTDMQPKRPLDEAFEFAQGTSDRYFKRPIDEEYEFAGEKQGILSPETMVAGFGFMN